MTTLLFVLGTRPETIKLAPVIHAANAASLTTFVVHTGQHHDANLSRDFFAELALRDPDAHLEVGSATPSLQLARMLEKLEPLLQKVRPAAVIVQGDTNSTLAGALAANKLGIPVVHVEAGLRSYDRRMPEEHNRRMVDHIADLLFAPTKDQGLTLRREGLADARIHVVGNTVADALLTMLQKADAAPVLHRHGVQAGKFAFMTLHRQENVDDPAVLRGILDGVHRGAGAAGL
ncbi:MAG TPA: UDP-N-acetylglucosamine 2-epimerase (non-hydrolyzing), partial [Planctomycetota bacterium]|nr:UDP-N-acetylglucosamine 2-epimerase (non-hydrolyzing) [Planctomycetota bacterium]